MATNSGVLSTIPILVGPTGSGKTSLMVELALQGGLGNAEVVSADSRQIYRLMDIGTAKPTPTERQALRHHLIDFIDPGERYSAGRFRRDAETAISDILGRGKVPVVVGGTGLYLKALAEGLSPIPEVPRDVTAKLGEELMSEGLNRFYERLTRVDPRCASGISANDPQRILRALGVWEATGKPLSEWWEERPAGSPYRFQWLGIGWERDQLRQRLRDRTRLMMGAGLEDEVRSLLAEGYTWDTYSMAAPGYREWQQFFAGTVSRDDTETAIFVHTAQYAKRQMTWFKTNPHVLWLNGASPDVVSQAADWLRPLCTKK